MTPQQWIEAMGAGWNLGNVYECHSIKAENLKYRYWGAGGNWKCSVTHNGDVISTTTSVQVFKNGIPQEFTIEFTCPDDGAIAINLTHPKIETGLQQMEFFVKSVEVNGSISSSLVEKLTFSAFSNFIGSISTNFSTISNGNSAGKTIKLTLMIDKTPLNLYPTSDQNVLSDIRKWWCTYNIGAWGAKNITEAQVKAVATVGFKAVRIPITWKDHCDPVGDNGHVTVDPEFLEHIAGKINLFHEYGLMVVINMHHDDQDWLKTGTYLSNPANAIRYKDIWSQIATYFKGYGDWLAFASNNETRNDSGVWEGAGVTATDTYGLMKIQKDFYDTVRSISGNAQRICLYPTYAAKQGAINNTYINPNNSSDTGIWHLPYNDAYGIAEVHPYNNGISIIQQDNNKVYSKGIPVIYGEFGVNASQTHDKQTCINQAYMVAYAKYHGIGTFLWDDDGGMQMLRRGNCKMNNSSDFDKLWSGAEFNFIPSLIQCVTLKQREILLNNRRTSCYRGDTVEIYLDTEQNVIVSNEGSGDVALSGNSFTAGNTPLIDNLLAISYIGEYNTIDVTVEEPQQWVSTTYDINYNGWEHKSYQKFESSYKTLDNAQFYSLPLIPISSSCAKIVAANTTNSAKWVVMEYDANKNTINYGNSAAQLNASNTPYDVSPNCAYLGICLNTQGKVFKSGTFITIQSRDMTATEEKDETASYTDSVVAFDNYNVSIYRTISAAGGMEYTLDMGMPCSVYVREYNGNKIQQEGWYQNGDTFTTNLFTKTIRLEIVVPNNKIEDLVDNLNDGLLVPKLRYTDYATHVSQYNETHTPIDIGTSGDTPTPHFDYKFCTNNNKLLTYNGKIVKI